MRSYFDTDADVILPDVLAMPGNEKHWHIYIDRETSFCSGHGEFKGFEMPSGTISPAILKCVSRRNDET